MKTYNLKSGISEFIQNFSFSMEDNRYHSGSQSYSSDYKPSGYTDFSSDSKSYNYQSDDYYKSYDDFSSYSNESQNKSYDQRSFQSNPTSFHSDQNNFSFNKDYNQSENNQTDWNSYESQYKKTPHQLQQQALNHYQQQIKRLEASKTKSYQNNPRERQAQAQQQAQPPQQFQQPNPNRRFTVRDVLQMPLSRQQYLKGLQIQNLRLQPQFKAILQRPNVVLGIADYYEKIIPDKSFTKEVGSIKMGKDYKEILWLTSMLAYFFLKINQTQINQSKFFKFIKGPKGFIVPAGLTFLLMMDNNNTRKKTANLVFDPKNQPYVNLAVRKFICDTSYKERVQIFGQT